MDKLLVIDGNSIINRAFYGIMGNKMLMLEDGTYTNAVYGFLSILFKELEDLKPNYLAIAFDLKAPTKRHILYSEYKATRHGMPNELAAQMPILKDVLRSMNIEIIEKEGFEADDILGTLAKWGKENSLEVTILTGDRDSFQLIEENIKVRIPRTKAGKTETEDYTVEKIKEEYGLEPLDLIEVKGLMGDSSDNIPGVPGVGEKTALSLIQKYKTIDNVYENIEEQKGKLKEKLAENKELAYLSRTLGTIDINAPIEKKLEKIQIQEWNKEEVLNIFKKLKFNRFIERFKLTDSLENNFVNNNEKKYNVEVEVISDSKKIEDIKQKIYSNKIMYYYLEEEKLIVYIEKDNLSYCINNLNELKDIFENRDILKCSYKQKEQFITLWKKGIEPQNLMFDISIAGYLLNSNINKYTIEYLANEYLSIDINEELTKLGVEEKQDAQITLFASENKENKYEKEGLYSVIINNLYHVLNKKLQETESIELFNRIEMPLVEVLASMQYEGIYIDKDELIDFGKELQDKLNVLTNEIHELADEDFNINSTKQLGEILFEKLKLTHGKKTKTGYSTDVDTLEKLKYTHPIIEKLLEYRQLAKLNSTYVEGLIPFIDEKTKRIHSKFHQTVTATGRISSTDPNLQNIPTRFELGQKLRKVFKPETGKVFIDADYSQIELRILAHISEDENMIKAFKNNEDIHQQAASMVLNIPLEEVTKEQRSKAKAVNFGIVYGISEFGLAGQIGVSRKQAKEYIEQYLQKYSGIKAFMDNIAEEAKQKGYVETLYHRRRYIPELNSNNYMVRQFGARAAMNTPIQGTAADIMKIAMINVYNKLKEENLKSKILVQVHDELLIEAYEDEKEKVKEILKKEMENAITLNVPLRVDLSEGHTWYESK
ncbi:MAG: DNA polymerase I [Clostridiales bacterium]|nr:DNA polymerase I [Clostridiales bacterium]